MKFAQTESLKGGLIGGFSTYFNINFSIQKLKLAQAESLKDRLNTWFNTKLKLAFEEIQLQKDQAKVDDSIRSSISKNLSFECS